MFSGLRAILPVAVMLLAAVPAASAWSVSTSDLPAPVASIQPWLPASATAQSNVPSQVMSASACALGDVNHDGVDDLLARVQTSASSPLRLIALAGPDFKSKIWEVPTTANRLLECAPDLNGDGIADPVMQLVSTAGSAARSGGPAAQDTANKAMDVIDGTTGDLLMHRSVQDTHAGAGASASAGVNSNTTNALLPAAAGAEALVQDQVQRGSLPVPAGVPVPLGMVTATARHVTQLQLLDVKGTVQGTVKIDQPGVDPLALAPLPVGGGLPDVAALTAQTAGPVDQVTSRVPTLDRFNPDGTLAWATQLNVTQGVPVLVPHAGDLNADGIEDIIVEAVPSAVGSATPSFFQVVSGLDGKSLMTTVASAAGGSAAALPLGSLPDGQSALLAVQQAAGSGTTTISAVTSASGTVWSVALAAGSAPINLRTDAYTNDPLGFTDLSGDGVPDVAVLAKTGTSTGLQTINGATGKVTWATNLTDITQAVPIASVSNLKKLSSHVPTLPSDILGIGNATKGISLTMVQGTTGKVAWTIAGALPGGTPVDVVVNAAGDLNKDGIQDILVTATAAGHVPVPGARDSVGRAQSGTAGSGTQDVYAVSGADGTQLWSNSTNPSQPAPNLTAEHGPAYQERASVLEASQPAKKSPGAGPALIMCAAVIAVWAWRRRDA